MHKFPIPDRRKNDNDDGYHREIEVGSILVHFDDERPALIERWYDCDTELFFVTVFYSSIGIEDWLSMQHAEYLARNGIIRELGSDIRAIQWIDAAKQPMWSLNFLER
jgi:hypothetical protein